MSTAPIFDDERPHTWNDQLPIILERAMNFATRDEARSSLVRMALLAELYIADHQAKDGHHTNARVLVRESLRSILDADNHVDALVAARTNLQLIAGLADLQEI